MSFGSSRSGVVLAIWVLGQFGLIGCAKPLYQAEWLTVTSPRFEILSTMTAEETKDLARELERFHALIYRVTNAKDVEAPIPTKIFAFRRRSEVNRYIDKKFIGMFRPGVRDNQILLSKYSRRRAASDVIFHEYVHFVVRNGTSRVLPMWYDEGFAEFLSTAEVRDDRMAIGIVPKARVPSFKFGKWLSMDRVISSRSYSEFSSESQHMFYAEAWALVHYLTLGRIDRANTPRDLDGYMLRIENGLTPRVAFENAFGESIDAVDRKIRTWLRKRKWNIVGIELSDLEYDRTEPTVRIPSRVFVATSLGELSLRSRNPKAAEDSFVAAISLDPSQSRAHAGLGHSLKLQDRWDEAEPHFRRAVDLDPNDPLNLIDLAEYLHDLAVKGKRPGRRRDLLLEARRLFIRSLEMNRMNPEAWSQLGWTYLAVGDQPAKGVEIVEMAFRMLPSSARLASLLADAYVATDQEAKARRVVSQSIAIREERDLETALAERIERIRKRLFEKQPDD